MLPDGVVETGVHAVGRKATAVRHGDVGGGEAEQTTTLIPDEDLTPRLVRMTQHRVRPGDVATGESAPDRRAADGFVHTVGPGDQADRLDLEVGVDADLAEQIHVAVAVATEVEVLSDHDQLRVQTPNEDTIHERLGCLRSLVLVERHDHDRVDTGRLQQLHLLFGRGQQPRRGLGTTTLAGCRSNVTTTDFRPCRARHITWSITAR